MTLDRSDRTKITQEPGLTGTDAGRVASISGSLTRDHAPDLVVAARTLLSTLERDTPPDGRHLTLDLGKLSQFDTSALAFMLEVRRMADQRGCHISFKSVPSSLLALARLSSVDKLLQLA